MSTPYLDEAERCGRVALINRGKVMVVDTPQRLKGLMGGEVIEVVTDQIRGAAALLSQHPGVKGVQAFGDRLNVVVEDSARDVPAITRHLRDGDIRIVEWRVIPASLENIFVSLMSHDQNA